MGDDFSGPYFLTDRTNAKMAISWNPDKIADIAELKQSMLARTPKTMLVSAPLACKLQSTTATGF